MRIDLPQCDFKNCRRCFDGNCNSKMAFRDCQYQRLKEQKNLRLDVVSSESGDWHGLYANGRLFFEGDEIPVHKVVGCVYQFFPLDMVEWEIPQDIAEKGLPKNIEDIGGDCL